MANNDLLHGSNETDYISKLIMACLKYNVPTLCGNQVFKVFKKSENSHYM